MKIESTMSTRKLQISWYIACWIFGAAAAVVVASLFIIIPKNPKLAWFAGAIAVGAIGVGGSNLMVLRKRYKENK